MLDRVSTTVLGLDGQGGAGSFADYSQWESWQAERQNPRSKGKSVTSLKPSSGPVPVSLPKRKLSYLDSRDFETIEQRISEAEEGLTLKRALLEHRNVVSDPELLQTTYREVERAQDAVDQLYARWAELEAKIS